MNNYRKRHASRAALLLGASFAMLGSGGYAFGQEAAPSSTANSDVQVVEAVTVTGSRITSINTNAPTPVTIVSTEQLQQTTPSNLPDGLNKLPVFQGSVQPTPFGRRRRQPGPERSQPARLRLAAHPGADRRSPPDPVQRQRHRRRRHPAADAGVARRRGHGRRLGGLRLGRRHRRGQLHPRQEVHRSEDRHANAGISTYGDGKSYKFGIAGGSACSDGRGHVLGSYSRREIDEIRNFDRAVRSRRLGADRQRHGRRAVHRPPRTSAAPTPRSAARSPPAPPRARRWASSSSRTACWVRSVPGSTTGTGNQNVGGDGAYVFTTALVAPHRRGVRPVRFRPDRDINFYVQASYAKAFSGGWHFPVKLTPGNGQASTFYKNNPFLTPQPARPWATTA
jgi:iron complex outermembrane receptor protein